MGEICKSNLLFEAGLNSDLVASDFVQSWKLSRKGRDFPYLSWPLLRSSIILSVILGLFASFYQSEFHFLIYGHGSLSSHSAHQQGARLIFFITSLQELAGCCCCCASSELSLPVPSSFSGAVLSSHRSIPVAFCWTCFAFSVSHTAAPERYASVWWWSRCWHSLNQAVSGTVKIGHRN